MESLNTEMERKNIPIFFIVGRPRSGTTLLRTLFDAHPHVLVPPECQFIINLYPKYGKIRNWTPKKLKNFYRELNRQWLFELWPLEKEHLLDSLMKCKGENDFSTICKVVYQEYQSVFEHENILAFGDKNPGYTIYTEKLLKIFPDAKFIHIIRDYRDNFISIRNVDFELPFISLTTAKWKIFVKRFRKVAERHPGTHIEIRYEDLAANPEKQFEGLCRFLNLPYSNIPFGFYKKGEQAKEMYPEEILKKYQSSLFKKISTDKIGLWKDQLNKIEIKSGDATAGKYAELCGYEKKYPRPSIWIRLRILPGQCFASLLSLATKLVDTFPYRLRIAILIKAPWVMGRIYLSIFNRKKLKEVSLATKKNPQ